MSYNNFVIDETTKQQQQQPKRPWHMKNKYLVVLNDWASRSTCFDGVPSIGRSHDWSWKIIWILSLAGMLGYCAYSLTGNIEDYLDYDVNTQISIQRQPSIEFPTITFCNKDPYKINGLSASPQTNQVFASTQVMVNSWIGQGYDSLSVMTDASYNIRQSSYYVSDLARSSYSIDDMLISCLFNSVECNSSFFYFIYTNTYGNCYQFNLGKLANGNATSLLKTASPGRSNGLRLELFTGYMSTTYDVIKSSGIQLFVHNSSYTPSFGIEGVSLSVGYEYDAVVQQTFNAKQAAPYSDCLPTNTTFDSGLFRATLQQSPSSTYNQYSCMQLCSQDYLVMACGCWDIDLLRPPNTNAPPCSINQTFNCLSNFYDKFFTSDNSSTCFDECPEECNTVSFDLELSWADFPSITYANIMLQYAQLHPNSVRNFSTYAQIKSSSLAVNIYYDDISYVEIYESPARTVEQLIADIGAILGLCIGGSFLSVVEIAEIAFRLVYVTMRGSEAEAKKKRMRQLRSAIANNRVVDGSTLTSGNIVATSSIIPSVNNFNESNGRSWSQNNNGNRGALRKSIVKLTSKVKEFRFANKKVKPTIQNGSQFGIY